jgi:hypothetical protein
MKMAFRYGALESAVVLRDTVYCGVILPECVQALIDRYVPTQYSAGQEAMLEWACSSPWFSFDDHPFAVGVAASSAVRKFFFGRGIATVGSEHVPRKWD